MTGAKNVFTVPSGVPFAKSIAARLLEETKARPESLSAYRILLPTRRACQILREAFLRLSDRPLLLPRIQPLGDVDEEELSFSLAGKENAPEILNLPPAIPPMKRRLLLAQLIGKAPEFSQTYDQTLLLADSLAQLVDHVHSENLDMADLDHLVPDEFSDHWKMTLKFLSIIRKSWPAILAEAGLIDPADRRNRVIRALSRHWTCQPPTFPVIAAGSTGSMPATAELLNVIAGLPEGCVVLPGLDQDMDEESWAAIGETHPQFGLKKLLSNFDVERSAVKIWPCAEGGSAPRRAFISEVMRPAETTQRWAHLSTSAREKNAIAAAMENLKVIECAHEREEADIIAVSLRHALETPGKTAALVTPDRALARRVAASCRRWGIIVDDSGGRTLAETPVGRFLRLIAQAAAARFSPATLLALLNDGYCAAGMARADFRRGVEALEKALRGPRPLPGLEGISEKLERNNSPEARAFLEIIAPRLSDFLASVEGCDFSKTLKAHIETAELLAARPDRKGAEILWRDESGEAAAALFGDLFDHADMIPPLSPDAYGATIETLMRAVTVRPAYGAHPRIKILGQLEARMAEADLFILAGLNEGTWPENPKADPWMSRPMRGKFGLPAHERSVGLSAQDFAQAFCGPEVTITRARRVQGAPAAPSRWLQRMDTILAAAALDKAALRASNAARWAQALDRPESVEPQAQPAPRPPLSARPRRISASKVETLIKNPYGFYARYILDLRKLDALEKAPDAADRGILLHKILKRFAEECPREIPDSAAEILQRLAEEELSRRDEDPHEWSFWRARFGKIAEWFVVHERSWREVARPALAETRGAISLDLPGGAFSIEATPDRIDLTPDGAVVIDYKSSDGGLTYAGMESGALPQLSVEAMILQDGGFKGVSERDVAALSYWILSGGAEGGEIMTLAKGAPQVVNRTREGIKKLLASYDDESAPYRYMPRGGKALAHDDYEHLARAKEWSATDAESEAA